jgi:dynein assembly factor 1
MEDYPRMTEAYFNKLLKSDFRMYYLAKELNEKLYLHFKGFHCIENLQDFNGLKALYLESNAIEQIEGLEALTDLRCLYLQENCIKQIKGLETLSLLGTLNLDNNYIEAIPSLEANVNLHTLLLQRNRIGVNGVSDLIGLLSLPNLSVLDLSKNKIDDEAVVSEVFEKMPSLSVLHFSGNSACKKIPTYRKTMTVRLPNLKYLDYRPIFEEDRRFAEAFAEGGLVHEREKRRAWNIEQEAERTRQHDAFWEMFGSTSERQHVPQSHNSSTDSLMDHLSTGLTSTEEDEPELATSLSQVD